MSAAADAQVVSPGGWHKCGSARSSELGDLSSFGLLRVNVVPSGRVEEDLPHLLVQTPSRQEATSWAKDVLDVSRCELAEHVTHPWSTVWRVATERGRFWLKHNAPVHRAEGSVQMLLAELAPDYVDAPLAIDARHGWILAADGGMTLIDTSPETRGIEVETLCRVLQDYGHLQRLTASSGDRLRRVGMETLDPLDTARQVRDQADWMAHAPAPIPDISARRTTSWYGGPFLLSRKPARRSPLVQSRTCSTMEICGRPTFSCPGKGAGTACSISPMPRGRTRSAR